MANKKRKGERPDGLIQRSLQIGYKDDGSPERKYFYGHSAAEAERKRDEYKAQRASGSVLDPDITVADWVEIYKATYREGVNPAYIVNDNAPYKRLVNEIGKMRVVDVRETHLQLALNKTSGMSFSTVTKYCATIKRVFRKARKNQIIPDDPSEDLKKPPSMKGSHRALESWEVEHVLKHWGDEGVRAGLWVMIMMLCGLRRGELIALRWENISLQNRVLKVCETAVTVGNKTTVEQRAKTDAGLRSIPICNTLIAALETVPEEKRSGLVCLSRTGGLLTESGFNRGIESFVNAMERIANNEEPVQQGRRSDCEKKKDKQPAPDRVAFSFRPHDLRHTFATALYDAGVPVKAAQYFLGHSDVKITLELYTHLSQERESASRLQMVSYLDNWVEMRNIDAVKFAALGDENDG